jgi:hypothetical protein
LFQGLNGEGSGGKGRGKRVGGRRRKLGEGKEGGQFIEYLINYRKCIRKYYLAISTNPVR